MTLFSEIRLHRVRTIKTLAMYTMFISYGLTAGLIGPTLLDLQLMTNSTLDKISFMLPGRSAGGIVGSLLMGAAYPHINFQLFVSLSMAATVFLHVCIPLSRSFYGLIFVFFINGIFGGFAGSGANIHLLELWGKEQAPFMQALHFCYGLGALIAPLIARPFLLQEGDGHGPVISSSANGTSDNFGTSGHSSFSQDDVLLIYPYSIVGGFTLIPAIFYFILWRLHPKSNPHPSRRTALPQPQVLPHVPSSIIFDAIIEQIEQEKQLQQQMEDKMEKIEELEENEEEEEMLNMKNPEALKSAETNHVAVSVTMETPPPSISESSSSTESLQGIKVKDVADEVKILDVGPRERCQSVTSRSSVLSRRSRVPSVTADVRSTKRYQIFKTMAIALMMCFMPIYYGLEMTVGSFLATFSVESDLHLSKSTGAYMTSVYWSMFTFVRLSTVFYIDYIGAELNVIINLAIVMVANCFLIPWGASYEWALWTGSTLMGIGCSSIWASAFGYLEDYFPVSSRIASLIMMSTALGDFVFPFVISNKITEYPNVFLDVTLFCSVTICVIFALVVVICKLRLRVKGAPAIVSTGQDDKKHFH